MSTMTPPRARRTSRAPNRFSSDMSAADNMDHSGASLDSNDEGPTAKHSINSMVGKIKLKPLVREPLKVKLPKLKRLQPPQHTKEKQPSSKQPNIEFTIHKIKLPSFNKKSAIATDKVSTMTPEPKKIVSDHKSSEKPKPTNLQNTQSTLTPPKMSNVTRISQSQSSEQDQSLSHMNASNASFSTDADMSSKGNNSFTSDDMDSSGMEIVIEKADSQQNENGIRCPCGVNDDIGVMVECEKCSTWQHGHCINVGREEDAYEGYICAFCTSPQADSSESLSQLTVGDKLQPFFDELVSIWKEDGDTAVPPPEIQKVLNTRFNQLHKDDIVKGVQDLKRVVYSLRAKLALLTSQKYETELRIWQNSCWDVKNGGMKTDDTSNKTFYFIDRCKANLRLNIRNMIEKTEFRCKVFHNAIECKNSEVFDLTDPNTSASTRLETLRSSVVDLRNELEHIKEVVDDVPCQN